MTPQAALVEIETALGEHPDDLVVGKARIREILDRVQPRYWLAAEANRLVAAYKRGDFGDVHHIIDGIIAREIDARAAEREAGA